MQCVDTVYRMARGVFQGFQRYLPVIRVAGVATVGAVGTIRPTAPRGESGRTKNRVSRTTGLRMFRRTDFPSNCPRPCLCFGEVMRGVPVSRWRRCTRMFLRNTISSGGRSVGNQEFRSKIRPLKTRRFPAAEIRCIMAA